MKEFNIGGEKVNLHTPVEMVEYLDERIIGQDHAKKVISVAIYNHYKRLLCNNGLGDNNVPVSKSNILLSGPTGCGKTAIVKQIAGMMNLPCYVADSTSITQAGYVGDDVESVLVGLLRASNYNVHAASYGIVILDEVDKLAKRASNQNITRDVVGEGVQQALLKMVEGGIVGVPPKGGRKHPDQDLIYIDTTNILFIGTGAFTGLDDIIKARIDGDSKIGFDAVKKESISDTDCYKYMNDEDLKKFGLIPEFIGRFPIHTYVNKLDTDMLKRILLEPKDSIIKQYQLLFDIDGIKLTFTDGAIDKIAECASKMKTGARSLRNIVECVLLDLMYETPSSDAKTVKIDKNYVKNKLEEYKYDI